MPANNAQEAFNEMIQYNKNYYDRYSAWYSGDSDRIRAVSNTGSFWKKSKCGRRFHVPLAADIATYSSDLLFSESPSFYLTPEASPEQKQRFEEIIKYNDLLGKLVAAGETCSALGDIYLKINWDKSIGQYPLVNIVQPDWALPEFTNGILTACNFITTVKKTGNPSNPIIYRLFEYHEKGRIYSELYKGNQTTLGNQIDFGELHMDVQFEVSTNVDDLLCVHIPNMLPNRLTRSSNLGRSDYEGIIPLMDALDEVYSSWMRDLNLGKARLIIPAEYLKQQQRIDPISGEKSLVQYFDEEDDLYVSLDIEVDSKNDTGIVSSQFDIRADEHLKTCLELLERIVSSSGYSPQSFGLKIEGRSDSGTALHIRERKSFITKAKKETYWKSRLEKILTTMLQLDNKVFNGNFGDEFVTVEFKDSVADDINTVANSVKLLKDAGSASTKTRVSMLHPDWDEESIEEEIILIQTESGEYMPDPLNPDPALDMD